MFGWRNRGKGGEGVTLGGEHLSCENADRASPQRETWRRAAQTVTRTWSEWSAADGRKRSELYRRYTSALDEEEQAASKLERLLSDDTPPDAPCHCLAPAAHDGEPQSATDPIARWVR